MTTLYSIRDWARRYETHETRKLKRRLRYIYIPTSQDGKGYRRLMALPDGVTIFGVWVLLLEIAAKCPERGILADDDGALTPEDMASISGAPVDLVNRALEVLSSSHIGWISRDLPESPANFPEPPGESGESGRNDQISRNLPASPGKHPEDRTIGTGPEGPDRTSRDGTGPEGRTAPPSPSATAPGVPAPVCTEPGDPKPEGNRAGPELSPAREGEPEEPSWEIYRDRHGRPWAKPA